MLSYTGIAPFPSRRVACGQLSTPAARDSSLPSRAVATFPSSALNSAFTSAFIYSIAPDALMISVIRFSKLSDADCLTSTVPGKTIEPSDNASIFSRKISINILERSYPCGVLA